MRAFNTWAYVCDEARRSRYANITAEEFAAEQQRRVEQEALRQREREEEEARQREAREKAFVTKAMRRWTNQALLQGFNRLKWYADERVHAREVMTTVGLRMKNKLLFYGFSSWKDKSNASIYRKVVLQRAMIRIVCRSLNRAFESWCDLIDERRRKGIELLTTKSKKLKAVHTWRNKSLVKCWKTWSDVVSYLKWQRHTVGMVSMRWKNKNITSAWNSWCEFLMCRRSQLAVVRKAVYAWVKNSQRVAVNSWKSFTQRSVLNARRKEVDRALMTKAIYRWQNCRTSSSLFLWRETTYRMKCLRQTSRNVFQRMILRSLGIGWNTWVDNASTMVLDKAKLRKAVSTWMRISSRKSWNSWIECVEISRNTRARVQRDQQILMKAVRRWEAISLLKCFNMWVLEIGEKRRVRHVAYQVICRMTSRKLWLAFSTYDEVVYQRVRARNLMKKAIRIWASTNTGKAFRAWLAHVVQTRSAKQEAVVVEAVGISEPAVVVESAVPEETKVMEVLISEQEQQLVDERKEAEALANLRAKAIRVWRSNTFGKACRTWAEYAATRARSRRILMKVGRRIRNLNLARVLSTWSSWCSLRRYYFTVQGRIVKRMRQRGLALCFDMWEETVAAKRVVASVENRVAEEHMSRQQQDFMKKVISHMRSRGYLRVLLKWKEFYSNRKISKLILSSIVSKMQQRCTAISINTWKEAVATSQANKNLLRKCISHWRHSAIRMAFRSWYVARTELLNERFELERSENLRIKAIRRWTTQSLSQAFRRWVEASLRRQWARRGLQVSIARFEKRGISRGFNAWHFFCQNRKVAKRALHKSIASWTKNSFHRCLNRWIDNVSRQRRIRASMEQSAKDITSEDLIEQRLVAKAARRWLRQAQSHAFNAWVHMVEWTRHSHKQLLSVATRIRFRHASLAFTQWAYVTSLTKVNRSRLSKVWNHWANHAVSRAFTEWGDVVNEERERRNQMERMQLRLNRAIMHWKSAKSAQCFNTWYDETLSSLRLKRVFEKCARRIYFLRCGQALTTWIFSVSSLLSSQSVTRKVIQKWTHTAMNRGFRTWSSTVAQTNENRRTIRKVVNRWSKAALSRGYQTWTAFCRASLKKKGLLRKTTERWMMNSTRRAINQWIAVVGLVQDAKYVEDLSASLSEKAVRRWMLVSVSRVITSWKEVVAYGKWRLHIMSMVQRRMKNKQVAAAFDTWCDFAYDSSRKKAIKAKVARRFVYASRLRSFLLWVEACAVFKKERLEAMTEAELNESERARLMHEAEQAELAAKTRLEGMQQKALRCWSNRSLSHGFKSWLWHVDIVKHARQVISGICIRVKNRSLFISFVTWQSTAFECARRKNMLRKVVVRWRRSAMYRAVARWQDEVSVARAERVRKIKTEGVRRKAMRHWTNMSVMRAFNTLRERASYTKWARGVMGRLVKRVTHRELSKGLYTWMEIVSIMQEKAAVLKKVYQRWIYSAKGIAFRTWLDVVEYSREAQYSVERNEGIQSKALRRWTRIAAVRSLNSWRSVVNYAKWRRRTMMVVYGRMTKRLLSKGWHGMVSRVSQLKVSRQMLTKAIRRWQLCSSIRALGQWKRGVEIIKHERIASMSVEELDEIEKRRLEAEKEEANRLEEEKRIRLYEKAARKWRQRSLSMAFSSWNGITTDKRFSRMRMVKAIRYWMYGARLSFFARWVGIAQQLKSARLSNMTPEEKQEYLRLSEEAEELRVDTIMTNRAVRKWSYRGITKALNSWKHCVVARTRARAVLSRFGLKMRNKKLTAAFASWNDNVVSLVSKRNLMRKITIRWIQNSLARALACWITITVARRTWKEQKSRQLSKHSKAVRVWISSQLGKAFSSWKEHTLATIYNHGLILRVTMRWTKKSLSRGFGAWKEMYSCTMSRNAILRKVHHRWIHIATGTALRSWISFTQDARQYKRTSTRTHQIRSKAARRWAQISLLRAVNTWKSLVDYQKWCFHTMDVVRKKMQNRHLSIGLHTWESHVYELRRERQIRAKAARRIVYSRQMSAFVKWVEAASALRRERYAAMSEAELEEAERERLMAEAAAKEAAAKARLEGMGNKAVRRWIARETSRAFNWWMEFVVVRVHARSVIARTAIRIRHRHICLGFSRWREVCESVWVARDLGKRAIRLWQRQNLVRGLRSWRETARAIMHARQYKAGRQNFLNGVVHRLHKASLAKAMNSWKGYVFLRKWALNTIDGISTRLMNRDLSAAMNRWIWNVESRKRVRDLLIDTALRWKNCRLSAAFETWSTTTSENLYARCCSANRARKAGLRWRYTALWGAFSSWRQVVCSITLAKTRMRSIAVRISQRGMASGFFTWVESIAFMKNRKRLLEKVSARWGSISTRSAFIRWREHVEDVVVVRLELSRKMRKVKKAVSFWTNLALHKSFSRWYDMWYSKRLSMRKIRQTVLRLQNHKMSMVFDKWLYAVLCRRHLVVKLQRFGAHLRNKRLSIAINTWQQLCNESWSSQMSLQRQHHVKLSVASKLTRGNLLKAFTSWSAYVEGRNYSRSILNKMLLRIVTRKSWAAFHTWKTVSSSRKRNSHAISMTLKRIMKARLHDAFEKWFDDVSEAKHLRRLRRIVVERMHRLLVKRERGLLGEMFDHWSAVTQMHGDARHKLSKISNRMLNSTIFKAWYSWSTFCAQKKYYIAVLRRVARRMILGRLSVAFETWVDCVSTLVERKVNFSIKESVGQKAAARWCHSSLARYWTQWAHLSAHRRTTRTALIKYSRRIKNRAMWIYFSGWSNKTLSRRRNRNLMTTVVKRALLNSQNSAFLIWKVATQLAVKRRARKVKADNRYSTVLNRWRKRSVWDAFTTWKLTHADRRQNQTSQKLIDTSADLARARDMSAKTTQDLHETRAQLEKMQELLSEKNHGLSDVSQQLQQLVSDKMKVDAEVSRLEVSIEHMEKILDDERKAKENLGETIAARDATIRTLEGDVKHVQDLIEREKLVAKTLQSEIDALRKDARDHDDERDRIVKLSEDAEARVAASLDEASRSDERRAQLELEIKSLMAELEVLRNAARPMEEEILRMQTERSQLRDEVAELRHQNNVLSCDGEGKDAKIQKLTRLLAVHDEYDVGAPVAASTTSTIAKEKAVGSDVRLHQALKELAEVREALMAKEMECRDLKTKSNVERHLTPSIQEAAFPSLARGASASRPGVFAEEMTSQTLAQQLTELQSDYHVLEAQLNAKNKALAATEVTSSAPRVSSPVRDTRIDSPGRAVLEAQLQDLHRRVMDAEVLRGPDYTDRELRAIRQELDDRTMANNRLHDEISRRDETVADLQKKLNGKEGELSRLEGKLKTLEQVMDGERNDLALLRSQLGDAHADVQRKNSEARTIGQQLGEEKDRADHLASYVSELEAELGGKSAEIEKWRRLGQHFEKSAADFEQINQLVGTLKADVSKKDKEISHLLSRFDEGLNSEKLSQMLSQTQAELLSADAQLQVKEDSIKALEACLGEESDNRSKLANDIAVHLAEINVIKGELDAERRACEDEKDKHRRVAQRLEDEVGVRREIESNNQVLLEDLEGARAQLSELNGNVSSLREQVSREEALLIDANSKNAALQEKCDKLLADVKQKTEALRASEESKNVEEAQHKEELQKLTTEVETAEARCRAFQSELSHTRDALEKEELNSASLSSSLGDCTREVAAQKETVTSLQANLQKAMEDNKKAMDVLNADSDQRLDEMRILLKAESDRLRHDLATANERANLLQNELDTRENYWQKEKSSIQEKCDAACLALKEEVAAMKQSGNDEIKRLCDSYESRLADIQREAEKTRLHEVNDVRAKMHDDLARAANELALERSKHIDREKDILKEHAAKVQQLLDDHEEIRVIFHEKAALESTVADLKIDISQRCEDLNNLNSRFTSTEQALGESEAKLARALAQVDNLASQLNVEKMERARYENDLKETASKLEECVARHSKLEENRQEVAHLLEEQIKRTKETEDRLEKARAETAQATKAGRDEVDRLKGVHQKTVASLESAVEATTEKLVSIERAADQVMLERNDYAARLLNTEKLMEHMSATHAESLRDLEEKCRNLVQDKESLVSQNQRLESVMQETTSSLSQQAAHDQQRHDDKEARLTREVQRVTQERDKYKLRAHELSEGLRQAIQDTEDLQKTTTRALLEKDRSISDLGDLAKKIKAEHQVVIENMSVENAESLSRANERHRELEASYNELRQKHEESNGRAKDATQRADARAEDLSGQIDSLVATRDRLERSNASLVHALEEAKTRIATLEKELSLARSSVRGTATNLFKEVQSMRTQLANLHDCAERGQNRMKADMDDVNASVQARISSSFHHADLQRKHLNDISEASIANLQEQLADALAMCAGLQHEIDQIKDTAATEAKKATAELAEVTNLLDAKEKSAQKLNSHISELQHLVLKKSAEVEAAQEALNDLRIEKQNVERIAATADDHANSLSLEISSLKSKLDTQTEAMKSEDSTHKVTVANMLAEFDAYKSEMNAKNAALEDELCGVVKELKEKDDRVKELVENNAKISSELEAAAIFNSDTSAQLKVSASNARDLAVQQDALTEELKRLKVRLDEKEEENRSCATKNVALHKRVEDLEDELAVWKQRQHDTSIRLEDAKTEITSLKATLSSTSDDLTKEHDVRLQAERAHQALTKESNARMEEMLADIQRAAALRKKMDGEHKEALSSLQSALEEANDALAGAQRQANKEALALTHQVEQGEKSIRFLEEQLADAEAKSVHLNEELSKTRDLQQEAQEARVTADGLLQETRAELKNALSDIESAKEVAQTTSETALRKTSHLSREIEELRGQNAKLMATHEDLLEELKSKHNQKIDDLIESHQTAIRQLKSDLSILTDEKTALKNKLIRVEADMETLEQGAMELKRQLATSGAEVDETRSALATAQKESADVKQSISAIKRQKDEYQAEMVNLRELLASNSKDAESRIMALNQSLNDESKAKEALSARLEQAISQADFMKNRLDACDAERKELIDSHRVEREELSSKMSALLTEKQDVQESLVAATVKLEAALKDSSNLASTLDSTKDEMSRLLSEKETARESLEAALDQVKEHSNDVQTRLRESELRCAESEKEVKRVDASLIEMRDRHDALDASAKEMTRAHELELSKMNARLEELSGELVASQRLVYSCQEELGALKEAKAALSEQCERAVNSVAEKSAIISELQAEIKELRNDNEEQIIRARRAAEENDSSKRQQASTIAEFESTCIDLRSTIDELKEQLRQSGDNYEALSDEVDDLRIEINTMESEIAQKEEELLVERGMVEACNTKIADLEHAIDDLTNERNELRNESSGLIAALESSKQILQEQGDKWNLHVETVMQESEASSSAQAAKIQSLEENIVKLQAETEVLSRELNESRKDHHAASQLAEESIRAKDQELANAVVMAEQAATMHRSEIERLDDEFSRAKSALSAQIDSLKKSSSDDIALLEEKLRAKAAELNLARSSHREAETVAQSHSERIQLLQDEHKKHIAMLENHLDQRVSEVSSLEEKLRSLHDDVKVMESNNATEVAQMRRQLADKLDAGQAQLRDALARNSLLQDEVSMLKNSAIESSTREEELRNQISDLNKRLHEVETRKGEISSNAEANMEKLSLLEIEVANLAAEKASLKLRADALSDQLEGKEILCQQLEADVKSTLSENSRLIADVAAGEASLSSLTEKLKEALSSLKESQGNERDLKHRISEKETRISNLLDEVSSLRDKSETLTSTLVQCERSLESAATERDQMRASLDERAREVRTLTDGSVRASEAARHEIAKLKEEVSSHLIEIKSLRDSEASQAEHISNLTSSLADANIEKESLVDEVSNLSRRCDQFEHESARARTDASVFEGENRNLKGKLADADVEIRDLESEKARLEYSEASLRSSLEQASANEESLRHQVDDLEGRNTALSEDLDKVVNELMEAKSGLENKDRTIANLSNDKQVSLNEREQERQARDSLVADLKQQLEQKTLDIEKISASSDREAEEMRIMVESVAKDAADKMKMLKDLEAEYKMKLSSAEVDLKTEVEKTARLERDIARSQRYADEMEESTRAAMHDLESATGKIASLEKEIGQLNTTVDSLSSEVRSSDADLAECTRQLEAERKSHTAEMTSTLEELQKSKEKSDDLERTVARMVSEIEDREKALTQLRAELQNSEDQIRSLRDEASMANDLAQQEAQKARTAGEKAQEMMNENESLIRATSDLDSRLVGLRNTISSSTEELKRENSELHASLQETLDRLADEISKTAVLQSRHASLERDNKELNEMVESLMRKVDEREESMEVWKLRHEDSEKKLSKTMSDVEAATRQREESSIRIRRLENEKLELEKALALAEENKLGASSSLLRDNDTLNASLRQKDMQIEEIISGRTQMEHKTRELEKQLSDREVQIQALTKELDAVRDDAQSAHDRLNEVARETQSHRTVVQSLVGEASSSMEASKAREDALQARVLDLQGELDGRSRELEELSKQMESIKRSHSTEIDRISEDFANRIMVADNKLNRVNEELRKVLDAQASTAEHALQTSQSERDMRIAEMTSRIVALESEREDLHARLEKAASVAEAAENERALSYAEHTRMSQELASMEKTIADVGSGKAAVEIEMKKTLSELALLRSAHEEREMLHQTALVDRDSLHEKILAESRADIEVLHCSLSEAEGNLKEARESLEETCAELSATSDQLEHANSALDTCRLDLQAMEERYLSLKDTNNEVKAEVSALQENLKLNMSKAADAEAALRIELDEKAIEAAEARNSLEDLKKEKAHELRVQMDASLEECSKLEELVTEQSEHASVMATRAEQLETRLMQAEDTIASLRASIAAEEALHESTRSLVDDLRAQNDKLHSEVKKLREFEEKSRQLEAEITGLKHNVDAMVDEVANSNIRYQEAQALVKEKEKEVENLSKALSNEAENLSSQLVATRSEVERARQKMYRHKMEEELPLRMSVAELEREREIARAEAEELRERLSETEAKLASTTDALAEKQSLADHFSVEVKTKNKEIKTMENDIALLMREVEEQSSKTRSLKDRLRDRDDEVAQASGTIQTLEAKIQMLASREKIHDSEIEDLRRQLHVADRTAMDLRKRIRGDRTFAEGSWRSFSPPEAGGEDSSTRQVTIARNERSRSPRQASPSPDRGQDHEPVSGNGTEWEYDEDTSATIRDSLARVYARVRARPSLARPVPNQPAPNLAVQRAIPLEDDDDGDDERSAPNARRARDVAPDVANKLEKRFQTK